MPIPKGKCQKCESRHYCGVSDLIHPDDVETAKKYGVKFEVRVTECKDYSPQRDTQ